MYVVMKVDSLQKNETWQGLLWSTWMDCVYCVFPQVGDAEAQLGIEDRLKLVEVQLREVQADLQEQKRQHSKVWLHVCTLHLAIPTGQCV